MALRALIWDVDGTLAETERDGHRVAFNAAFAALGLPWHWDEARYGELLHVTGGYERLLHDMTTRADAPPAGAERDALARELHALKNRHYGETVARGEIPLRPGVRELIEEAGAAGLPQAIATTTSRSNVQALLGAHFGADWQRRFACVLCGEDAPQKKPDPLVYRMAIALLGISPHDALAIEDSSPGVRASCAAHVPVIATRSVYFAQADLAGALAVGPGLHTADGWTPAAMLSSGRIDLPQLRAWHHPSD